MKPDIDAYLLQVLLTLLQAKNATEVDVREQLQPLTRTTSTPAARLGHTYLGLKGDYFELTATFTAATQQLKQVSLWVTSPAFVAMKAFARALPPRGKLLEKTVLAQWKNQGWGIVGHLLLRPAKGNASAVSARFVGLLPGKKLIILTRR